MAGGGPSTSWTESLLDPECVGCSGEICSRNPSELRPAIAACGVSTTFKSNKGLRVNGFKRKRLNSKQILDKKNDLSRNNELYEKTIEEKGGNGLSVYVVWSF